MDYKKEILTALMKKHYSRVASGSQDSTRKISIKPTAVFRDYGNNHADFYEKKDFDKSVSFLSEKGFVFVKTIKYGVDVEEILLNKSAVSKIEEHLESTYSIQSRGSKINRILSLVSSFRQNADSIVDFYCEDILKQSVNVSVEEIDLKRYEDILVLLRFLEQNKEDLYPREISQLCFADTKYIEDNKLFDAVSKIARNFFGEPLIDEKDYLDSILSRFHVMVKEQLITIKGDVDVWIGSNRISGQWLKGGISLSSSDFKEITKIKINTPRFMTIENETSFLRFSHPEFVTMYLGGFATRFQIEFLNLVHQHNKEILFFHFGDLDVGGFRILSNLNSVTECFFEAYFMDDSVLKNDVYRRFSKPLSDTDKSALRGDASYIKEAYPTLKCVEEEGVKLEQEIVALYLMKPTFSLTL